jgi:hypothetical protein
MKINIRARQTGKTTDLIFTADMMNIPIITFNQNAKNNILLLAKNMLSMKRITSIPVVYSCNEKLKGKNIEKALIDEVGHTIENML